MKYKELGYNSLEEYKKEFYETLMPSNNTKDYFVDWKKVKSQVKDYVSEIFLLNSLIKYNLSERESKLEEMLDKYPESKIRKVIPLILVVKENVTLLEVVNFNLNYKNIDFDKTSAKEIANFCSEVGILKMFDEIKDLHDYLIGTGVGRDTNARKNRSGTIFQKLIQDFLNTQKISYIPQDHSFEFKITKKGKKKKKYPDFVIYKDNKPFILIEVNFYNTTGSKPLEVVESYIKLHRDLKNNVKFLWITDGPAWLKMSKPLDVGFNDIDYVMNYNIFKDNINKLLK